MSNTIYIEEALKEFREEHVVEVGGRKVLLDSFPESVENWFKSKLTQAIRDTEVKTAEKLKMEERETDIDSYGYGAGVDEGYNVAVKNLNDKIDQIINTNQED